MMAIKKIFEEPACIVTHFDVMDIIATSDYKIENWDTDMFAYEDK